MNPNTAITDRLLRSPKSMLIYLLYESFRKHRVKLLVIFTDNVTNSECGPKYDMFHR